MPIFRILSIDIFLNISIKTFDFEKSKKARFYVQHYPKLFLSLFSLKQGRKLKAFDQNHGLTPLKKNNNISTFELMFL